MIVVPWQQLQPETLHSLIEEFVTRQGAVHGHAEVGIETQIAAIRQQLEAGAAVIVFDEASQSCTIAKPDELNQSPGVSEEGNSCPAGDDEV